MRTNLRDSQRAFTLIELLVALIVLGVVVGVAIPNFKSLILNQRSVGLAEDFINEVNLARSEAVARSTRVSICPSINGTACAGTLSQGFIVFIDGAATDAATDAVVGLVLRVWLNNDPHANITATRAGTTPDFIRFSSIGTLARLAADPTTVVNTHWDGAACDSARKITIGLSGTIMIEKGSCQ